MAISRRQLISATAASAVAWPLLPLHAQDMPPVVLGFVTPMSSSWGQDVMKGVDLAVKMVNASGGIGQRPVKVVSYDDLGKPEEGVAAVERLITRDKAKIIMGSFTSSGSMAQQTVTERHRKLHFVSFAQADDVRDASHGLAFFQNATVGMLLAKYLDFVATEIKPQRVVVLANMSDYGQASVDTIKQQWSSPGSPQVVSVERFESKQPDLSPQLTKIRGLRPAAVFVAADSGEAVANALSQMRELKVPGLRLTVPGILSESFLKIAGSSAENLVNGDFYFHDMDNATNRAFVQAFRAEYKYNPSKLEMIGFEAVDLAAQLLTKAGVSASDEALARALKEGTWASPRGTLSFVPMSKAFQAEAGFTLLTVKDGRVVRR